jgi:hypothetical protein
MESATDLHVRLEALERKLRTMQVASLGLLLLLAACFAFLAQPLKAASASEGGILHVRGIVITDANGTERIHIGAPVPSAVGEKGPRRSELTGMTINDAAGREHLGLGLHADGWAILGFDAPLGVGTGANRERLHLGVDSEGHGFVRLLDQESGLAGRFLLNREDRAAVEFWGKRVGDHIARSEVDLGGWHSLPDYQFAKP